MSAETKRKCALVGFTISRDDAPYDDPEWSVAGCNNLHAQPGMEELWPKCDGWYDLHDLGTVTGTDLLDVNQKQAAEVHTQWLREGHKPCFVMPAVRQPDWPSALDFPRDEILAWAQAQGIAGWRYFTNSVSWMIAHCLFVCVQNGWDRNGGEIALYGIDMAQSSEYGSQRPSCEYWLGVAEGAGLTLTIPQRSDLLKCAFQYGVDAGAADFMVKMRSRIAELEQKSNEANIQWEGLRSQMEQTRYMQHQFAGALEDARYVVGVWGQQAPNVRQGEVSTAAEPPSEGREDV